MSEPATEPAEPKSTVRLAFDLSAYTPQQQAEIRSKLARIHGLSFASLDALELFLKTEIK